MEMGGAADDRLDFVRICSIIIQITDAEGWVSLKEGRDIAV